MIVDTYYYLLDNQKNRSIGLFGESIAYKTPSFNQEIYQLSCESIFSSIDEAYLHWKNFGRKLGFDYAVGKNTILKIILKAKDEPELIEKWISHHSSIVGYHNIIILDCGSEDEGYIKLLSKYKNKIIILDYKKYYDYIHSVNANTSFFKLISDNCKYVTILDADEFLFGLKDGLFSGSCVCDILKNSSEFIHAGIWINNYKAPEVNLGKIDWSKPIDFDISVNSLKNGAFSGKSIIKSSKIFESKHLGHNMHVYEVLKNLSPRSFGEIFIFHVSTLSLSISKERIFKHLSKKNVASIEDLRLMNLSDFKKIKKESGNVSIIGYLDKIINLIEGRVRSGDKICSLNLLADASPKKIPDIITNLQNIDFKNLICEALKNKKVK